MTATDLLQLARSDPREAMARGGAELAGPEPIPAHRASLVLRALSIAARSVSTMAESVDYAQRAIDAARESGDDDLLCDALVTYSGSVAIAGEPGRGLMVLDEAERVGSGVGRGRVHFQRARLHMMRGDTAEALGACSQALRVFRRYGDEEAIGASLHNRALLHLERGDLGRAEADLRRAREIHELAKADTAVIGVDHNLGLLAWYRGDIPGALHRLSLSESRAERLLGLATPAHATRCEVLMSAGLYTEARALAERVAAANRDRGDREHEADSTLVAAQAALLSGDCAAAALLSDRAAGQFREQGRPVGEMSARRVHLEARFEAEGATPDLGEQAQTVAAALDIQNQLVPASYARLLAGRVGIELGRGDALAHLAEVARLRSGPIELRLHSRLAAALMRRALGDTRGAVASIRSGMRSFTDYQAAMGASDLRSGLARRASELASLGLDLAFKGRSPRRVFAWAEAGRAGALRFRPVTPPDDRAHGEDLAQLRRITLLLRDAGPDETSRLRRREEELHESIRRRARTARGGRWADDGSDPSRAVAETLGDRILVEYVVGGDELWAVVARHGRFRLRSLGPLAPVLHEVESLRFTLRRLARRPGDPGVARRIADRIDQTILRPLHLADAPVVLVPTPKMYATPWSALPSLVGRRVLIAPSAWLWVRAGGGWPRGGPVVVAAGPGLRHAVGEAEEVASLYRDARLLPPEEATVVQVATAMEGAGVAHVASHAELNPENPMFSSLHLGDGDLFVYDIERLRRPPRLVVLSACDSGLSETRAGDELLGLSSALLALGTRSVVAGVGLVPDGAATRELMVGFHRGLVEGLPADDALCRAQEAVEDSTEGLVAAASFICIGAT